MTTRCAINGFGRTGRAAFRAAYERELPIEWAAINDVAEPELLAHLLRFDTVYGPFPGHVEAIEGAILVDGVRIETPGVADPAALPWRELGVDVVVESTGRFRARADAAKHLEAGARKVIVSAPAKEPDVTVALGINFAQAYDAERHHVISNASCTTNCLAPVAKLLHEAIGIRHGLMTTVHAYTGDQCPLGRGEPRADVDRRREGDRARRARAGRQAARLRRPRAGPDRLARRPHDRGGARDERRGGQRALPHAGRRRRARGHPALQRGPARLVRHRPVELLGDLRRPADDRDRRDAGEGDRLVRQRVGLLEPARRARDARARADARDRLRFAHDRGRRGRHRAVPVPQTWAIERGIG